MKAAIIFLSGLASAFTGVFIRSCDNGAPAEFARAWCGAEPLSLAAATHAHCSGCAAIALGVALLVVAPMVDALPRRTRRAVMVKK